MFNEKNILITGATGSWGNMLVTKLLSEYSPNKIVCFSRGELQQVLMKRRFPDSRIQMVVGDVRDYAAVDFAMRGIDIVFHLAALKHVPICEDHPQEAIKTNIDGTTNVINAAIKNGVQKVIDVSTDKAVAPNNLYGMTKSVGEKLIIQANTLSDDTRFVCVRGGNVMGSNGSVIPFFIEQINNGGPITITDKNMTRFFLTLEEAIGLLFKASEVSLGGEIFVMNMPACKITTIAEVLKDYLDMFDSVKVVETGIRAGEKFHEVLVSASEAPFTYENGNYYVILPPNPNKALSIVYQNKPKIAIPEFASNTVLLEKKEVEKMLYNGGFLRRQQ